MLSNSKNFEELPSAEHNIVVFDNGRGFPQETITLPKDLITPLVQTAIEIPRSIQGGSIPIDIPKLESVSSPSLLTNSDKNNRKEPSPKIPSIISLIMSPDAICPPVAQEENLIDPFKLLVRPNFDSRSSFDKWTHRIYCISLKTSIDRRERIKKRFRYHGLLPWLTFVDAIPLDSPLIQRYVEGTGPGKSTDRSSLAVASCFASHLKALRIYLEDSNASYSRGAIICEDDILLRNSWRELYESIMGNMPISANMIQFSYMLDTWGNTQWVGNDPRKENIFRLKVPADYLTNPHVGSTAAWGTQMYWISISQAIISLNQFDRPFIHHEFSLVTAELITVLPRGYFVYPAMVIEDCIGSLIREKSKLDYHVQIFSPWGYSNYSGGDDDGINDPISPLFHKQMKDTGTRPPPPPKSNFADTNFSSGGDALSKEEENLIA